MGLSLRKRGRYWHVRGSVRVGRGQIVVCEQTTGCDSRETADAVRTKLEADLRAELLDGRKVAPNRFTFADAGTVYIDRPGVHQNDLWRVGRLNDIMGDYIVADALEAWQVFRAKRCVGLKPATVERFRKVASAALNLLAKEHGFDAPKLPSMQVKNERVRFLTVEEQEKLLASYAKHVRPIALFLCYTGARTQEALQIVWRDIDFARNTAYFSRTKNGEPRTVPLHPRVRAELESIKADREPENADHVFLNRYGEPYADTRDYVFQGGNPIAKAHRTACKRAGVSDFRVHDWRHHWASRHVMHRTDFETLRRMGGWKSLVMVQRYAAVSDDHMQAAVASIA